MAVCLLEIGDETQKKEAAELLEKVPDLRQRIAGKSIPLEVRLSLSDECQQSLNPFAEIRGP